MLLMWVELSQVAAVDTSVRDVTHIATHQHCHFQLLHHCYWYQCTECGFVVIEKHNLTELSSELLG
jgi:hypothetical protein